MPDEKSVKYGSSQRHNPGKTGSDIRAAIGKNQWKIVIEGPETQQKSGKQYEDNVSH